MTPAEVAEWLTEKATDAKGIAMDRYPSSRTEQLRDEAAQLRLLVETAAEWMHQFERERERHVDKIAQLRAHAEVLEAGHAVAAANFRQRIANQASKMAAIRKEATRV